MAKAKYLFLGVSSVIGYRFGPFCFEIRIVTYRSEINYRCLQKRTEGGKG